MPKVMEVSQSDGKGVRSNKLRVSLLMMDEVAPESTV
jgi:hypothetical protein